MGTAKAKKMRIRTWTVRLTTKIIAQVPLIYQTDFILPDSEFPVTSGHGSSEARLRDESADELRELAESFKEHQRQNRDSEDDSQSFGQIYQVAVQVH